MNNKNFGTADSLAIGSLNAEQQVAVMKLAQAGKVAISYLKRIVLGLKNLLLDPAIIIGASGCRA